MNRAVLTIPLLAAALTLAACSPGTPAPRHSPTPAQPASPSPAPAVYGNTTADFVSFFRNTADMLEGAEPGLMP